jgi:predicted Rossmann-fold nucleotide-binding protein
MTEAINDKAIKDIIIDEIVEHYPHLIEQADELADELGPYLVESMWSAFDKDLEQELHNKGD